MDKVLLLQLGLTPFPFFSQVLTSHSCSEEGLEDAANVLLQLSRGDPGTRDTVLKLLLNGARHLGYTLCKQIGNNNRSKTSCFPSFFFFKYILLIILLQFSQFFPLYPPSALHPPTLQHPAPLVHVHRLYI